MSKRAPLTSARHTVKPTDTPPEIERLIEKAPGGAELLAQQADQNAEAPAPAADAPEAAQKPAEPGEAPAPAEQGGPLNLDRLKGLYKRRETTRPMTIRMPESLYERMSLLSRLTGVSMTDLLVAGAEKEVAKLEHKVGLTQTGKGQGG